MLESIELVHEMDYETIQQCYEVLERGESMHFTCDKAVINCNSMQTLTEITEILQEQQNDY